MKYAFTCFFAALSGILPAQSIFDSLYTTYRTEIHFASGQAELPNTSATALDSIGLFFQQNAASYQVRITAHTDSIGASSRNDLLAQRRAAAVQNALIKRGILASSIQIATFGERLPAMANATEAGRQVNRRATVEIRRMVPMTTLAGQIKEADGRGIPSALVTFSSASRRDSVRTDTAGHYRVRLPQDSLVRIEASTKDHFFKSVTARLFGDPTLIKKYKFDPNLVLPSTRPGEKMTIQNLLFVGDQAVLLEISKPELVRVARFMQENPTLKFEIAGHINAPGFKLEQMSPADQVLSSRRAEVVCAYLVQHGIDHERLTSKGYGNTQMLFPSPKASAAEQQQNRRVEIRVVE